ncbi:MAG: paraquat-inducible membrane protein A, partial [Proteobacteria bacterium]
MKDRFESDVVCDRCGFHNHKADPKSAIWSLAFSLTALVLWIPANIYPFMTIELYGNRNTSTIWGGIVSLNESGSWPIALIVFLASLL